MNKFNIATAVRLLVLLAIALRATACGLAPTPTRTPAPTPTPQPELTAKEAYEMAYERASEEYDNLYLYQITAGGTTFVAFKKGHPPVEAGRSDHWWVTFHWRAADGAYTQVFVAIRGGEADALSEGGTFNVDWEDHLERQAADFSQWEWKVDSPQAVEIAKEQGWEGLGAMYLRLGRTVAHQRRVAYLVVLGPISGEGGRGLEVYIDAADGTVLKTEETTWK